MLYNRESGYGRVAVDGFPSRSPNGKIFMVGAANLQSLQIVKELYKFDPAGVSRFYGTLAAALLGCENKSPVQAVTMVVGAPGVLSTLSAHGLNANDRVYLQTTGGLLTGLSVNTPYYVIATGLTATSFQLALTPGGTGITTSSTQSGVHTLLPDKGAQDTIYILPNHFENITSATYLSLNVSGVNIVGLGQGGNRPYFYMSTSTAATLNITAPNVSIENCIFDGTGIDAIVAMVTLTAPDCHIKNNKFVTGNATNQVGEVLLTTAACDRLEFDNNEVVGTTDAGTTNALQLIGGNDIKIRNNTFFGAYTTSLGPINNITTACLRIQIKGNVLVNATASSTKAIVLVSGTTGVVADNRISILSGTAPVTGAGLNHVGGNYYTAAAGVTAGTLL